MLDSLVSACQRHIRATTLANTLTVRTSALCGSVPLRRKHNLIDHKSRELGSPPPHWFFVLYAVATEPLGRAVSLLTLTWSLSVVPTVLVYLVIYHLTLLFFGELLLRRAPAQKFWGTARASVTRATSARALLMCLLEVSDWRWVAHTEFFWIPEIPPAEQPAPESAKIFFFQRFVFSLIQAGFKFFSFFELICFFFPELLVHVGSAFFVFFELIFSSFICLFSSFLFSKILL